jgi:hypothetical protein
MDKTRHPFNMDVNSCSRHGIRRVPDQKLDFFVEAILRDLVRNDGTQSLSL